MIMRLTDDYLIVSDKPQAIKQITESLFKCSEKSKFQFNLKKLRANFPLEKFHLESNNKSFKWIGKMIDIDNLELGHNQILNSKEAYYTINITFPELFLAIPNFIKGKFKTFLLNQNLFYFNNKINSDKKILTSLPDIVQSACLKLNVYLNTLPHHPPYKALDQIQKRKFINRISHRLHETIQDVSTLICNQMQTIPLKTIFEVINEKFVDFINSKKDNDLKRGIFFQYKKILSQSK